MWVLRRLVQAIGAIIACYVLMGVAGSLVSVNGGWRQAAAGVRVYVIDNGVHTDLVLPASAEGVDWRGLAGASDLADPRQATQSHVAFGWGDRDFYLNTPSWRQVNPLRMATALVGAGRTVLHVSHVPEPRPGPHMRSVMLTPDQYRRLAAYVRATFGSGPSVHGYRGNDAFYDAKGGYSAIHTCNEWTAGALRTAGVRMAAWTPFTFGVMRWL